jgi:aryl-alcohol dehydrogenase-like predicted oxidoreductase
VRYQVFGATGMKVSELCLGTMTFGTEWGWGADPAESRRIFGAFAEAGGNFIDTASNYTDGTSERLVGEFAGHTRDRFVLATKYTLTLDPSDPNAGGNHRKSLVRSLEQSLRRLRTDHVDLLWLHMHDATTPIEETVRALDDQVRLGKVLYVGISDSPAWVAAQAATLAALRGWSPFAGLQIPYNVANRDAERELLPMAAAFGMTVTAWGVLGQSVLTGKPARERRWPDEPVPARTTAVADVLARVADQAGCTQAQAAIRWVLTRASPAVVPIIGARTITQLTSNLGALEISLTEDQLYQLDRAGAPDLGFPRAFLESDDVRQMIYGRTASTR